MFIFQIYCILPPQRVFIGFSAKRPRLLEYESMAKYNDNKAYIKALLHDIRRLKITHFRLDVIDVADNIATAKRICNDLIARLGLDLYNPGPYTHFMKREIKAEKITTDSYNAHRMRKVKIVKTIKLTKFKGGIKVHFIDINGKHSSTKFYDRDKNLNDVFDEAIAFAESLSGELTMTAELQLLYDERGARSVPENDWVAKKIVLNVFYERGIKIDISCVDKIRYYHVRRNETLAENFTEALEFAEKICENVKLSHGLKRKGMHKKMCVPLHVISRQQS